MILSRVSLFGFAVKKAVGQPGIIVDPESFRQTGVFPKVLHWFRNKQTFSDMERHLVDFNRSKSHKKFLAINNTLVENIERRNFKDLEPMLAGEYYKVNC